MGTILDPQAVPLQRDAAGVSRVAGTRVPLERVIESYEAGCTREQIAEDFDTVPLAAVSQVIDYYLSHQEQVKAYLRDAEAEGDRVRRTIEEKQEPSHAIFKESLGARQGPPDTSHAPTGK